MKSMAFIIILEDKQYLYHQYQWAGIITSISDTSRRILQLSWRRH